MNTNVNKPVNSTITQQPAVQGQNVSIPTKEGGSVNIHIANPSVSTGAATMPSFTPYYYPVYYPSFSYPPNYYTGQIPQIINKNYVNTGKCECEDCKKTHADGAQGASKSSSTSSSSSASAQKDEKTPKKEVVLLEDNYIKTLENYLRNNNVELRRNAIKEVLARFKEDKSRRNHPALIALMNLALQDPDTVVRAGAMSIINAGYSAGDDVTKQLLSNMQYSSQAYSQDATQAADALLKSAETRALVNDNSFSTTNKQKGYKS